MEPSQVILAGMMLGFPLSLLFFMDQNIAESMVNSPDNKLVKVITLLIIITSDSDFGLSLSHIIMAIFRLLATLKRTFSILSPYLNL